MLEKVFTAEMYGLLPFQSKSKIIKALEKDGQVEPMVVRMGPVTVKGWSLTHRGRITYCDWASKQPSSEED